MNRLITAEDTLRLAFPSTGPVDAALITDSKIQAAQSKYIRPAFPEAFYARLCAGDYPDFVEQFVRPALAYFVRYMVIPDLSIQVGNTGVYTADPRYASAASDRQREMLRAQALDDGQTLLSDALAELKARKEQYPDYAPEPSNPERVTIGGGVIFRRNDRR